MAAMMIKVGYLLCFVVVCIRVVDLVVETTIDVEPLYRVGLVVLSFSHHKQKREKRLSRPCLFFFIIFIHQSLLIYSNITSIIP